MLLKRNSIARAIGPVFFADAEGGDGGVGGGNDTPPAETSWRDALPDDMKSHPAFQDFKDVSGLAKSYLSAQEMIGKDKIVLPGEDDSEGWGKFYDRIGRPKDASGYEYHKPEGSEGLPFDEKLVKSYQEKFHELGLTKKQGEGLFKLWNDNVVGKINNFEAEATQKREAAATLLKAEWGQAYDQNLSIAKNVIKELGEPELIPFLNESGLGNDPRMIKIFYNIGTKISEDSFKGAKGGSGYISTPEQAKEQISRLYADEKFMQVYNTKQHPEHNAAVEKMSHLFQQAYPATK